jgi:formylglycine-generating enzyme required for sulfatase activity
MGERMDRKRGPEALRAIFFLGLICAIFVAGCSTHGDDGERREADRDPLPSPPGPPPEGMVLVPGGRYRIGSEQGDRDEQPVRELLLDPFYIDTHEVTNAEFARFVEETGYESEGFWRQYAGRGRERHPVTAVTWNDASAYAKWAGKRLPTEVEWEAAARGGLAEKRYPNGDALEGSAVFGQIFAGDDTKTAPVGSLAPNGYGLYDTAGNVWEWCADYYAADAYERADELDPAGPERGAARVARGGSWNDREAELRVSNRLEMTPTIIGHIFGFRCAKSP